MKPANVHYARRGELGFSSGGVFSWISGGKPVLTAGAEYQIQLISTGDTRGCCASRTQEVDNGAGDFTGAPVLLRGNGGDTNRGNDSVIGTFTADGTTQGILISNGTDPGLSGYVLRQVPEPNNLVLVFLGLLGLVGRG